MYQIFLDKVKKHLDRPSRNRLLQDIHDKQYPEFIIDLALFKKLRAYLSYPTALTSIIRDTLFAYTTGIPQASRLK